MGYKFGSRDVKERMLDRIVIDPQTGCWNHPTGKRRNAYAYVKQDGKQKYAHRVAYELFVGLIPQGGHIHHRCENKQCCNPRHLRLTTLEDHMRAFHAESMIRAFSPRHAFKTHCVRGHPLTPKTTKVYRPGERVCIQCQRNRSRSWRRAVTSAAWRAKRRLEPEWAARERAHLAALPKRRGNER